VSDGYSKDGIAGMIGSRAEDWGGLMAAAQSADGAAYARLLREV